MATNEGGVWRTVGGRRIFIKDGEDLASAMKRSGKFKSKKDIEHQKRKINNELMGLTDEDKKRADEEYDAYDKLSKENDKKLEEQKKEPDFLKNATDEEKENYYKNMAEKEKMQKMGTTAYLQEKQREKGNYQDEKTNSLQKKANEIAQKLKENKASGKIEKDWDNRNSYQQDDVIEYDTKYPLGLSENWKQGKVIEVKNDWASHGDTKPDKVYKVKDLTNGNTYEVSAGAVARKVSDKSDEAYNSKKGTTKSYNKQDISLTNGRGINESLSNIASHSSGGTRETKEYVSNLIKSNNSSPEKIAEALNKDKRVFNSNWKVEKTEDNVIKEDYNVWTNQTSKENYDKMYTLTSTDSLGNKSILKVYAGNEQNQKSGNDWVRNAYSEYKKEHPNSKITFASFKKTQDKK